MPLGSAFFSAMASPKQVLCPHCGAVVFNYDGRAINTFIVKCHYCRRYVKYNSQEDRTANTDAPPIETSSGKRFY